MFARKCGPETGTSQILMNGAHDKRKLYYDKRKLYYDEVFYQGLETFVYSLS